jgi:MSHA biogenesis protein MshO
MIRRNPGVQLHRGFTLLELIIVIVVLGILAVGTSTYIVQTTESYVVSAERGKLIASGRLAVEKITRRLRNALPNSIRISASNNCVEYIPVIRATNYTSNILVPSATVSTEAFDMPTPAPSPFYVSVAGFSASELYNQPIADPGVIALGQLPGAGVGVTSINLPGSHQFLRNSPTARTFITGNPERFCIVSGSLSYYTDYGFENSIATDITGTATASLVAENIDGASSNFLYTASSLVSNAIVDVTLNFIKDGDPVKISHQVQVRNVP